MIIIRDQEGTVVSRSKNLRGIRDYSRHNEVERIDLYPGPQMGVAWRNGSTSIMDWADPAVMQQWAKRFSHHVNAPIHQH